MPNTVPASAPALPNVIPFPRAADEQFLPILINPDRVVVADAEHKALRDAVSFLAMDHDELVAMATEATTEALQELRWMRAGHRPHRLAAVDPGGSTCRGASSPRNRAGGGPWLTFHAGACSPSLRLHLLARRQFRL